jgi:endo-alpha-1,4-polygalactosaminidase (GH114 family)
MEVKITEDAVTAAMHKAILEALGEKGREQIIAETVKYLSTPKDSYYGKSITPLTEIMRQTAEQIAKAVCKDRIEKDPTFIAAVEDIFREAAKKFMDVETREKLVNRLANAMYEGFAKDR